MSWISTLIRSKSLSLEQPSPPHTIHSPTSHEPHIFHGVPLCFPFWYAQTQLLWFRQFVLGVLRERKKDGLLITCNWLGASGKHSGFNPVCGTPEGRVLPSLPDLISLGSRRWSWGGLTSALPPKTHWPGLTSLDYLSPAQSFSDSPNIDKTQSHTSSFDQSFLLQNHIFNSRAVSPVTSIWLWRNSNSNNN